MSERWPGQICGLVSRNQELEFFPGSVWKPLEVFKKGKRHDRIHVEMNLTPPAALWQMNCGDTSGTVMTARQVGKPVVWTRLTVRAEKWSDWGSTWVGVLAKLADRMDKGV